MKNENMPEKIEDSRLKDISGGGRGHVKVAKDGGFLYSIKKFFGFGSKKENRKDNYLDKDGVYHINCIECGRHIRSWKPQPGSCYACGPQVCDDCKAKKSVKEVDEE